MILCFRVQTVLGILSPLKIPLTLSVKVLSTNSLHVFRKSWVSFVFCLRLFRKGEVCHDVYKTVFLSIVHSGVINLNWSGLRNCGLHIITIVLRVQSSTKSRTGEVVSFWYSFRCVTGVSFIIRSSNGMKFRSSSGIVFLVID